jgi:hypothetical protein
LGARESAAQAVTASLPIHSVTIKTFITFNFSYQIITSIESKHIFSNEAETTDTIKLYNGAMSLRNGCFLAVENGM